MYLRCLCKTSCGAAAIFSTATWNHAENIYSALSSDELFHRSLHHFFPLFACCVFILYLCYVRDSSILLSIHSFIYLSVCVCSLHSCCAARWLTTARRPRWPRSWACRSLPSPTTRPRGPSPYAPRRWPTCWSVGSGLCSDWPATNKQTNKHCVLQQDVCGS